jgi:hypothetical protein
MKKFKTPPSNYQNAPLWGEGPPLEITGPDHVVIDKRKKERKKEIFIVEVGITSAENLHKSKQKS